MKTVKIPITHKLRVRPKDFEACAKGRKNFLIQKNKRDFKTGDNIVLMEFTGSTYTGREITGEITYITDHEQKEGHVVFSFRKWSITSEKRRV